ncbi:MAG: hypothetical protein J6L83_02345 [Clostridia bacterium]|nr:hypothetical protein [Clostridia bacterium]
MKKVLRIIANVLLGIFLAISVFSVIITIVSKKDADGAAEVFGYQLRIVTSESMDKCDETNVSDFDIKSIPLRSMVFIEVEPDGEAEAEQWYKDIKEGDVLTFKYTYTKQVVITHRVVKKTALDGGGYIIELEGDNKDSDQQLLRQVIDTTKQSSSTNYIIGKVKGQSYLLGLVISTLQEPLGIVLLIILPCLVIIVLETIRIVGVLNGDKKQKIKEEAEKKNEEIEELKRRLAELEKTNEGNDAPSDSEKDSEEEKA